LIRDIVVYEIWKNAWAHFNDQLFESITKSSVKIWTHRYWAG